jgi:hypothetical protein
VENHELVIFCRDWFTAWMSDSPEQLRGFYTEDAFYSDPARPEGLRGPDLLPYFRKLLAKYPGWKWRAVEIMPTAKGFCLKWNADFRDGERDVAIAGLDLVEMRDGKISRNEVYFDRSTLLRH